MAKTSGPLPLPPGWHVEPLVPERWDDLVRLFGARGACGGCWCMFPRLPRKDYDAGKGEGNRRALERLVRGGTVPGVLGYLGDEPVAWCALAPRGDYTLLARSRINRPVDETPVWSIVCLFVAKAHRRAGLSRAIVEGAVAFAKDHGATCVEAYAVEPGQKKVADAFIYHGLATTYRAAGFTEVARRAPTRPILRRRL